MAAASSAVIRRIESVIFSDETMVDTEVTTVKVIDIVRDYIDPDQDGYDPERGRYYIPEIQRKWSWTGKKGRVKQNKLINTILRGLPVPSILLNQFRESGMDRYSIYDGRHRFKTLRQFYNNEIPYVIETGPEKGTPVYYKELSPMDQHRFNTTLIPTNILRDCPKDVEGDVFIRMNSGKPLNNNELCYAGITTYPFFRSVAREVRVRASRIRDVFGVDFTKSSKDTNMRKFIADWCGFVLAAVQKDPGLATTSFVRLAYYKDLSPRDDTWDSEYLDRAFNALFDVYTRLEATGTAMTLPRLGKCLKMGYINAFFLADFIRNSDSDRVIIKWVKIIKRVNESKNHAMVLHVTGAQNLNDAKIAQVLKQIDDHDWESTNEIKVAEELLDDEDSE